VHELEDAVLMEQAKTTHDAAEAKNFRGLLDETQRRRMAAETALLKAQQAKVSVAAELDRTKADLLRKIALVQNAAKRQEAELTTAAHKAAQQHAQQRTELQQQLDAANEANVHASEQILKQQHLRQSLADLQRAQPGQQQSDTSSDNQGKQIQALSQRLAAAYAQVRIPPVCHRSMQ
jgi:hypothetical protein